MEIGVTMTLTTMADKKVMEVNILIKWRTWRASVEKQKEQNDLERHSNTAFVSRELGKLPQRVVNTTLATANLSHTNTGLTSMIMNCTNQEIVIQ